MGTRQLLTCSNKKLNAKQSTPRSRLIYSWSIPAKKTCPGATTTCLDLCYADSGYFNMPSVQEGLQWRLEQSRRDDFVDRMLAEIDSRRVRVLRVHSAGDFYRAEYARKWLQIARARPKVRFTFWTRTWRVAKFRPALAALARRRNVTAYWSLDRDTGVPKRVPKRVRLAYVQADPTDRPPPGLALVFRAKSVRVAQPAQRVNGGPVCPPEQGRAATAGVTCETCRYCFPAASEPTKPGRFGLPVVAG